MTPFNDPKRLALVQSDFNSDAVLFSDTAGYSDENSMHTYSVTVCI